MTHVRWQEEFIQDIPKDTDEYFLMLKLTYNSISPILYQVVNGELEHSNHLNDEVFDKFINDWKMMK